MINNQVQLVDTTGLAAYHDELIAALSEEGGTIHVSGRTDWDVTDPAASGYIANKPFHSETVMAGTFPSDTIDSANTRYIRPSGDRGSYYLCSNTIGVSEIMTAGNRYGVVIDGVFQGIFTAESTGEMEYLNGHLLNIYASGPHIITPDVAIFNGTSTSMATWWHAAGTDGETIAGHTVSILTVTQLASMYIPVASTTVLGGVKVDGTTITADADGTLHGASSLTFDTAPTQNSSNPVTSGGLYAVITALTQRVQALENGGSSSEPSEPSTTLLAQMSSNDLILEGTEVSVINNVLTIQSPNAAVTDGDLEFS